MKPLKLFDEFLHQKIAGKVSPNPGRVRSLIEESEKRKRFLNQMTAKIGISDKNANYFIENAYDILIGLIRAKLLSDGFTTKGIGSHEAEVSYMRNLSFTEKEVRFMNELRFFRNRILYYGRDFDADYGKKVLEFLDSVYPRLKQIAER